MLPAALQIPMGFYPVGNTPAICLTQTLPPHEDAKVLLLGCGDLRNILFTIHSNRNDGKRNYDFTCCDIESAIIARNVLLLSLIQDNVSEDSLKLYWEIYHHIFLTKPALDLFQAQAAKLAGLSEKLSQWNSSEYSKIVRMVNAHTLSILHSYWKKYCLPSPITRSDLLEAMARTVATGRRASTSKCPLSVGASAAPTGAYGMRLREIFHDKFWRHGVMFEDNSKVAEAVYVNRSMIYTWLGGKEFVIHNSVNPILPYHLSPTIANIPPKDPFFQDNPKQKVLIGTAKKVIKAAHVEFSSWCETLHDLIVKDPCRVVIRFFIGDGLVFIKSLPGVTQGILETQEYIRQWTLAKLKFDGGDYTKGNNRAPASFNIIDTSNLADFVGLPTLLAVTVPCLTSDPWSTITTQNLLRQGPKSEKCLGSFLCGDTETLLVLFGVAPTQYLTGISSISLDGTASNVKTERGHFRSAVQQRLEWRRIQEGGPNATQVKPPVFIFPQELAEFLIGFYNSAFSLEDAEAYNSIVSEELRVGAIPGSNIVLNAHYTNTRSSLAHVFAYLKQSISTNWDWAMTIFNDLANQKQISRRYYHDFLMQLHFLGIFQYGTVDPRINFPTCRRVDSSEPGILSRKSLPSIVCVVLVIPNNKIRKLLEVHKQHSSTSQTLVIEVYDDTGYRHFSSIQATFGRVIDSSGETVQIEEDPADWYGRSPMIVAFYMPTSVLLFGRRETVTVGLHVQHGPTTQYLKQYLEPGLAVFKASIMDRSTVFIVESMPFLEGRRVDPFSYPCASNSSHRSATGPMIKAEFQKRNGSSRVQHMVAHLELSSPEECRDFLVDKPAVIAYQASPCSIGVKFGKWTETACFPYPVSKKTCKFRLARTSGYIEFLAPPYRPGDQGGFCDNPFEIYAYQDKRTHLFGTPYLRLSSLPQVDLRNPVASDPRRWLDDHSALTYSRREQKLRKPNKLGTDAMQGFKQTLEAIFALTRRKGIDPHQAGPVFSVSRDDESSDVTLIFLSAMRLDLTGLTVVGDCYILPLTPSLLHMVMEKIRPKFPPNDTQMTHLRITENIEGIWNHYLPSAVERGRENWEHNPDSCSLFRPDISSTGASIFCKCSAGRDAEAFATRWKEWAEVKQHVSKAALGLVFVSPFS